MAGKDEEAKQGSMVTRAKYMVVESDWSQTPWLISMSVKDGARTLTEITFIRLSQKHKAIRITK